MTLFLSGSPFSPAPYPKCSQTADLNATGGGNIFGRSNGIFEAILLGVFNGTMRLIQGIPETGMTRFGVARSQSANRKPRKEARPGWHISSRASLPLRISAKCRRSGARPTKHISIEFDENSEHSSFEYSQSIRTILRTRHDSDTVVTCTKYRCDRQRIFYTRVFWILFEFDRNMFSGTGPRCHVCLANKRFLP